jgi:hypothetical protein
LKYTARVVHNSQEKLIHFKNHFLFNLKLGRYSMDRRILLVPIFMLLFMEIGFGLTKYGDAEVKKGKLAIVRDGTVTLYDKNSGDIPVLKNDVLRVGKKSFVILNTIEETTIKMGANAVFQIRPWKQRNKTGYLRMLYGKIVFQTRKLLKKKRKFKIKTATATIGVKGTDAEVELTANSNLQILSLEGKPYIQSRVGLGVVVLEKEVAFSIAGKEVTIPIRIAKLVSSPGETGGLDKVPAGAPGGVNLNNPEILLVAGFGQIDVDNSKKELVNADEDFDPKSVNKPVDPKTDELDQEVENDINTNNDNIKNEPLNPTIPPSLPSDPPPDPQVAPDIDDVVDNAVQRSLIRVGRMKPIF